ncbi:MAG: fructose,6-bisphosphatase [Candidatus Binatota bacterium]|jgi:fructose-1,6-bisphosphatase I|nr:fructose,6-bisphosphatase [Candidatus Binatota bacterium]
MPGGKIVTIQRHMMEQQALIPTATGEFTRLMWDLVLAFKMISREVNHAGLADILGLAGKENVQGEQVMKLDEYAQRRIYEQMDHGGHLCCMASEEVEDVIPIPPQFPKGKYVLLFDPLDGSSNIDVNAALGTIFSIHRKRSPGIDGCDEDCLQRGRDQIAAGYCVYGSSTMFVYTTGNGVHGFTLEPSLGEFLLSNENIRMPRRGKTYSINEGNAANWDEATRRYVEHLKQTDRDSGRPYSLRYIGTLVADFHRTLLKGGIFLYPADCSDPAKPKPKLRLLYELAPMAMIAEQAGGAASTGRERVADIQPRSLHERVAVAIGSVEDVRDYESFVSRHS